MAGIEIGIMSRQALAKPFPDLESFKEQVRIWTIKRNVECKKMAVHDIRRKDKIGQTVSFDSLKIIWAEIQSYLACPTPDPCGVRLYFCPDRVLEMRKTFDHKKIKNSQQYKHFTSYIPTAESSAL